MMNVRLLVLRFFHGNFAHYLVMFFIAISMAAIIASSFKSMEDYSYYLFGITYISSFIFLVEYVLRLFAAPELFSQKSPVKARMKYVFSFYGFVDLVAILPCVLTYFYWNTQVMHIIILPYIFIIFKLIRYSRSFKIIGSALAVVKDELITAYTACLIIVSFSAIVMYYVERDAQPDVFSNIGDGFWWSIVSFTTTGYGDIYPITGLGKLLGSFISLIGIAMIAIPTAIISSSFISIMQERSGVKRMGKNKDKTDDSNLH